MRALRVVSFVTLLFFLLSWTADGNVENSVIYKIGVFIEPITRVFGLGRQTFMAFIGAAIASIPCRGILIRSLWLDFT
ncbi:MAG: hypothetical protein LBG24_05075 [Treponema sp.]|nr:hypothetical protein [Treponema sp.]